MTEITIRRKHNQSAAATRAAAEHMASRLQEKFAVSCNWEKDGAHDTLRFLRAGLSGSLILEEQAVALNIQLGFPFSALKPVIEQKILKFLDDNFPA